MKNFPELFQSSSDFSLTGIFPTRKTQTHGNINQQANGFDEIAFIRPVDVDLTHKDGMKVKLSLGFVATIKNVNFDKMGYWAEHFKDTALLSVMPMMDSSEYLQLTLTEKQQGDTDIEQYMIDSTTVIPEYAELFTTNLLQSICENSDMSNRIYEAFADSLK